MRADADDILANLLVKSASMRAEFERDFKIRKDPRITPIGRFLRRSSLDELPQFLNVLRGEMSLVGPRPIVDKELERYGEFMHEVASVRPGLTGLWQVSGRNNLSYAKRVRLDLAYARGRSFMLDLAIILRTFGVLLLPMDRGAYCGEGFSLVPSAGCNRGILKKGCLAHPAAAATEPIPFLIQELL